jgi:hypothetical protein
MFECELSGDESPRRESCLGYEYATRECRYDLVTYGEVIELRSYFERKVRYECPTRCKDRFEEFLIIRGIASVYPSAEYCYSVTMISYSDIMSHGVDPCRTTTDDSYSCLYDIREYFL